MLVLRFSRHIELTAKVMQLLDAKFYIILYSNEEVAVKADPAVEEQDELTNNGKAGVMNVEARIKKLESVYTVAHFEFKVLSNFEVTLLFQVKTDRLWETSRQYLWKQPTNGNGKRAPEFGLGKSMLSNFPPPHMLVVFHYCHSII